jgi:hypothetical protein
VSDASNQPELRLPTIVEVYRNFAPPSDLKSEVEMLLSYRPTKVFRGPQDHHSYQQGGNDEGQAETKGLESES